MNKETGFLKIRKIFSSIAGTIILAAIPSITIYLIAPVKARKYILETVEKHNYSENTFAYYDDLNSDGVSETIKAFDRDNTSGITILEKGRMIDQWNIRGSFSFILKETLFITADCDGNGLKEIYLFSISNDSILLSCLSSIYESNLSLKNRFIATVGPGSKAPDPSIIKAEAEDLDDDGRKELIFGIMTGFSKFPRRIYAYYIEKDSLVSSPESSSFITGLFQADINNDGKNEIMPYGYAARNISPEEARYHDYSAWLMVLDKNLNFLFEPVEFVGKFKHLIPIIDIQNGSIMELLSFSQDKDSASFICGFDKSGRILYRNYPGIEAINAFLTWNKKNPVYVFNTLYDGFYTWERNKNVLHKENISGFSKLIDIDLDGLNEIIVTSQDESRLVVYRSGFTQPAECNIEWKAGIEELISVVHKVGEFPLLSFQSGGKHYLIRYSPNSLYYWNFAYYPIVFSGFIAFVWLIQLLQRKRVEKKFETEKKISDLQLAMLRNQLDPHFTLNAINSVISSINNSEKESAVQVLRKFASLYRTMVLSAGKSRRSLDDEINFATEYLALEKIRFNGRFDYRFDISDSVNRSQEVPKMLIQFFAENAVKHAFNDTKVQGRLLIRVFNEDGLNINIEDNGIGRMSASLRKQDSTHKGFEIITELFKVYNKYYTEKIGFDIIDLVDTESNPAGTKIIIRIK